MMVAEMAELKTRRKRPLRPGPGLSASAPRSRPGPEPFAARPQDRVSGRGETTFTALPKRKKTCDADRPSRPALGRGAARLRRARPSGSVTAQEAGLSRRESWGGAVGLPRSAAPVPLPDDRTGAGKPGYHSACPTSWLSMPGFVRQPRGDT